MAVCREGGPQLQLQKPNPRITLITVDQIYLKQQVLNKYGLIIEVHNLQTKPYLASLYTLGESIYFFLGFLFIFGVDSILWSNKFDIKFRSFFESGILFERSLASQNILQKSLI